ncbi:1-phosphofructokinase [Halanaerobium praevalens]|uniref:Tagatose-6-phosphate kinase n=1 Tax=Halanaerobium praevalens (strain ATCC 33744 / DSM 2228 / GSL) TaxID=572479 RepID=E3DNJ1_HALPG|nr:1-phosphofructokinase [Halanaerobium praevalens]ADO76529.1 1-phosphofructokinase [Halanaerobium praevalens DSM 2228]
MIATITLNPSVDRRYNINELKVNTIQRTDDYQATAGGKGINVSRVIKLLDGNLTAMGFIGGYAGKFIKAELKKLKINNSFTKIAAETRSCINIIDHFKSSIEILEKGPEIKVSEKDRFLFDFKNQIKKVKVIIISGSLPEGIENDFYQEIIKIAKINDKKVILDTSGEALINGIKAGPDFIKPNQSELESIFNFKIEKEIDYLKAANKLQKMGAKNIAISLGAKGMYFFSQDSKYKIEVPEIEAINLTGSGDSLVAGLGVAVQRNMDIESSLKLANACGVANAVEKQTAYVDLKKVNNYIDKIKIKEI